jgi:hypothetical protein
MRMIDGSSDSDGTAWVAAGMTAGRPGLGAAGAGFSRQNAQLNEIMIQNCTFGLIHQFPQ